MNNTFKLCGLWLLLEAVAIAGRIWQPALNVTPMAGVALAAGAIFSHPLVAASVPVAALALSNIFLPPYESWVMATVVFAATAWPVFLGSVVRGGRLIAVVGGALASSLAFYLSTNFAYWCLSTDYPHTLGGLVACYLAALPFYRWMPVGDLVWSLFLFGGGASVSRMVHDKVRIGFWPGPERLA